MRVNYHFIDTDSRQLKFTISLVNGKYGCTRHIYSENPSIELFGLGGTAKPSSATCELCLASRVIPRNRQNIDELLASANISYYSWQQLIKINKGRIISDNLEVIIDELDLEYTPSERALAMQNLANSAANQ